MKLSDENLRNKIYAIITIKGCLHMVNIWNVQVINDIIIVYTTHVDVNRQASTL